MLSKNSKQALTYLTSAIFFAAFATIVVFGNLLEILQKPQYQDSDFGPAQLTYSLGSYSDLTGWATDDPIPAFRAFLRSCDSSTEKPRATPANPHENHNLLTAGLSFSGKIGDWRAPCIEARVIASRIYVDPSVLRREIRDFFEDQFQPVQILHRRAPKPDGPAKREPPTIEGEGRFTGYFEPLYSASRVPTRRYSSPLFSRPADLIDVDLGVFRDELKGERIAGRLIGDRLVPYPDHQTINNGALSEKAHVIAWLDPTDLFFLQIQGSGQLTFDDGASLRVGYAGQNGHSYTAIGRVMAERKLMALEDISMQSIRDWLNTAGPSAAREMREQNASYVFFRDNGAPEDNLGPQGAQGVALTAGRSLAVDRRYHALGAPVWVDIEPVEAAGGAPIRRLMIAQDTGGAIRGPIRGDFFWGAGKEAGEIAGQMNARGKMFVLLPKSVVQYLPASPPAP